MGIKQKEENTNGGLHNTLAAGTTVKGDIVTETDFRLDGKIEGNVSCNGKIVIGPKGNVTGGPQRSGRSGPHPLQQNRAWTAESHPRYPFQNRTGAGYSAQRYRPAN